MNREANDNQNPDQESPGSEPEIIIDSDWKEQVAREKEQAAKATGDEAAKPTKASDSDEESVPPPPPASFEILVSMLFTQAMSMLGQIPDPQTGKPSINKPYAKYNIDTLEMLGEKTKGNLSDSESKMLSEALHALRMTYVNVTAP